MITIYADKKYVKADNKELIEYVDLYFTAISHNIKLDSLDQKFMKEIDKATYKGNGIMETPFGTAFIDCLSSGCKALILINHFGRSGDKVVNITECGANALDIVYKMDNIYVMQTMPERPYSYDYEKDVTFVDKKGKQQITLREAFCKKWRTQ